jgi:hypothetical protein
MCYCRFYLSGGRSSTSSTGIGSSNLHVWRFDIPSGEWSQVITNPTDSPASRFQHHMVPLCALRVALPLPREMDPFSTLLETLAVTENGPYGASIRQTLQHMSSSVDPWAELFTPRPILDVRSARDRARETMGINSMVKKAEIAAGIRTSSNPRLRTGISMAKLDVVAATLSSHALAASQADESGAPVVKQSDSPIRGPDLVITGDTATLSGVAGGRKRSTTLRVESHLRMIEQHDDDENEGEEGEDDGGDVDGSLISFSPALASVRASEVLAAAGWACDGQTNDIVLQLQKAMDAKNAIVRLPGPGIVMDCSLKTAILAALPSYLSFMKWRNITAVLPSMLTAEVTLVPRSIPVKKAGRSTKDVVAFQDCARFLYEDVVLDVIVQCKRSAGMRYARTIVNSTLANKFVCFGGVLLHPHASSPSDGDVDGTFASLRSVHVLFVPSGRDAGSDPCTVPPLPEELQSRSHVTLHDHNMPAVWRLLYSLRECQLSHNLLSIANTFATTPEAVTTAKAMVDAYHLNESKKYSSSEQLEIEDAMITVALEGVRQRAAMSAPGNKHTSIFAERSQIPYVILKRSADTVSSLRSKSSVYSEASRVLQLQGEERRGEGREGVKPTFSSRPHATRTLQASARFDDGSATESVEAINWRQLMRTLDVSRPSLFHTSPPLEEPLLYKATSAVNFDGVSFKRGLALTSLPQPSNVVDDRALPFGVPRLLQSQSARMLLMPSRTLSTASFNSVTPQRAGLRRVPASPLQYASMTSLGMKPHASEAYPLEDTGFPATPMQDRVRSSGGRSFAGSAASPLMIKPASEAPIRHLSPASRRRAMAALANPYGKPMPMLMTTVMRPIDMRKATSTQSHHSGMAGQPEETARRY